MKVSNFTLISAFRYALGRMSTASSYVSDDIIRNWKNFTDYEKQLIKYEIQEAINKGRAGMECDVENWKRILELKD